MSHSVRSHLSLEIDAYDDTIRKFIPGHVLTMERKLTLYERIYRALRLGGVFVNADVRRRIDQGRKRNRRCPPNPGD